MTAPFTLEQEARIAEIARGIVADLLRGSDKRIRDCINFGDVSETCPGQLANAPKATAAADAAAEFVRGVTAQSDQLS